MRNIAMSVYVCLPVFSRISKTSSRFLRMFPVAEALSLSDDNAIWYVLPVLWMTSYLSSNNHADHLSAYAQFYDTVRRIHSNSPEGCTDSTRLGEICYTRLSSSLSERRTHVHGSILCDSIQPHQLTGPTQPTTHGKSWTQPDSTQCN